VPQIVREKKASRVPSHGDGEITAPTRTPGSDAGVVGVTSRAIGTLAATCKLRAPLPDSCAGTRGNAGAVEIRTLEIELDAELQLPREASCAGDDIESWVGDILVRWIPSRGIKDIETLEAELKPVPFVDGEFFEQRQVEISEPICAKRIAAEIPEGPECFWRDRKRRRVKPFIGAFVRSVQRHARHPVQAVIVPVAAPEVESERLVAANTDIKGLPRGERCDAIERPAADQIVHNFIFRREPLATSERQLVDPRGREYLGYVDCRRSPVRIDIIWVLDPTAFNSVPAGASDVDALRPCIGDEVS